MLYLSNDITHTCCLGVAEDCIPSHHAALTNLAVILAVVRLEASGIALEIFYGTCRATYRPIHVHLEEHILGVGVLKHVVVHHLSLHLLKLVVVVVVAEA